MTHQINRFRRRILFVAGACFVVGVTYWYISSLYQKKNQINEEKSIQIEESKPIHQKTYKTEEEKIFITNNNPQVPSNNIIQQNDSTTSNVIAENNTNTQVDINMNQVHDTQIKPTQSESNNNNSKQIPPEMQNTDEKTQEKPIKEFNYNEPTSDTITETVKQKQEQNIKELQKVEIKITGLEKRIVDNELNNKQYMDNNAQEIINITDDNIEEIEDNELNNKQEYIENKTNKIQTNITDDNIEEMEDNQLNNKQEYIENKTNKIQTNITDDNIIEIEDNQRKDESNDLIKKDDISNTESKVEEIEDKNMRESEMEWDKVEYIERNNIEIEDNKMEEEEMNKPIEKDETVRFTFKNGKIKIKLLRATHMEDEDIGFDENDLSDVFVVLEMANNKRQKSTIIKNSENPQWNEEFIMNVSDPFKDILSLTIEDYDAMTNDKIGKVEIKIIDVVNANDSTGYMENEAFDVVGSKYGWLFLDLTYFEEK